MQGWVGRAADYRGSSALAHADGARQDPCVDSWERDELGLAADWATLLEQCEQDAAELRAATYAGLPYGEPEFVAHLERAVQRPLRRLKPGRKPKRPAPQALRCAEL